MGSGLGLLGFALGPIAGGSLFAATVSSPTIPGALRDGHPYFLLAMLVLAANVALTGLMPAWPWQADGKQDATPGPGTPRKWLERSRVEMSFV